MRRLLAISLLVIIASQACAGEIAGRITHTSGAPLRAIVSVGIASRPDFAFSQGITEPTGKEDRFAFTDANGNYIIKNLPEGQTLVVAATPIDVESANPDEPDDKPRPYAKFATVMLDTGEQKRDIDFVFPSYDATIKVRGHVTINGAEPTDDLAGWIEIIGDHGYASADVYGGITDDKGSYEFVGLPPGRYTISACYKAIDSGFTTARIITVPPVGTLTVNLNIVMP